MAISRLKVQNFKSYEDLEIELGAMNVLIGPNASGKSNFLEILHFVNDILNYGLEDAVSLQGGTEFLLNRNIGRDKPFFIEIELDPEQYDLHSTYALAFNPQELPGVGEGVNLEEDEISYIVEVVDCSFCIEIEADTDSKDYKIIRDQLEFDLDFYEDIGEDDPEQGDRLGSSSVRFWSGDSKTTNYEVDSLPSDLLISEDNLFPSALVELGKEHQGLVIEDFYFPPVTHLLSETLGNLSIYDIDPKAPKRAVPISGKSTLEEDGSNLTLILKEIWDSEEDRQKFVSIVSDVLKFFEDINIKKIADRSMLFELKEEYTADDYLPASLLSDGSVHILALIIILYFERSGMAVIEEPDRNIHPKLLSRVIEMCSETAEHKQVLLTTHNPELIKHTDIENLYFAQRNDEGYSEITKPSTSHKVRTFLENDVGIDSLFIDGLLN